MDKKLSIKPSKWQSVIGFVAGIIFVLLGFFVIIPTFGVFGIVWTGIAILITITHGLNVWRGKGLSLYEVAVSEEGIEEKLAKIEKLYQNNEITKEEYLEARKEALKKI